MIAMDTHVEFAAQPIKKAADKAVFESLGHAAGSTRRAAIKSIRKSAKPAAPDRPVHTKKGLAKRAVLYAADEELGEAVVGFSASVIGEAMAAHERGDFYRGTLYPKRPTIGPALEAGAARLGEAIEGSIGT